MTAGRVAPTNPFTPFPKEEIEGSIPARFERIVREHGERLAVRNAEAAWTYRQLDEAARRVARGILTRREKGAEPVAVFLPTGPDLFSAMLGILQAGKFYIPIDPALGDGRNAVLLKDAGAGLLVTNRATTDLARRLAPTGTEILRVEEIETGPPGDPDQAVSPDDVAYVLFTSGSTGEPKGVVQSHRNVLHNILKLTNGLHITPEDRQTLLYSCSFGASVSDLFGALLNGAAVLPFDFRSLGPRRLAEWLEREELTLYHSVPGVFRQLAASLDGSERLALRLLKLGGEPVLASDLELYRRRLPRSCLFHVSLGATEINIIRQWFADHETRIPDPVAPLGWAVDETEIVLLGDDGAPAPGNTGEIAVVARTLALGYWKRPDLTAAAFESLPERPGYRLYRTGDLGRLRPDGCLLHLGRKDLQVKIRGYRVELAEVEAALANVPGVREAVVARRETLRGQQLVAWIVRSERGAPGAGVIRRSLAERLPGWMVPNRFAFVDALPRTPNGKVDRQALPDPGRARPSLETPFVPPRGKAEETVAEIFAEVLGLTGVGARDDFFDLGGDSLLVLELVARLEEEGGWGITPADLLEAPTPAGLAAPAARPERSPGMVVSLRRGDDGPPLFVVPGGEGSENELTIFARLARHLRPGIPVFGLRRPARVREDKPRCETLAATFLEHLRVLQPKGPYFLAGECVGGILALEMARRLEADGERVALLALLDTPRPGLARALGHRVVTATWPLHAPFGESLARRIRHHTRNLVARERGRRWRYLLEKLQIAARALIGSGRAGALSAGGDGEHRSGRAYVGELLGHRLRPFGVPITLLVPEEPRRRDWTGGWSELAKGRLDLRLVPGDHASYIREHAAETAAVLDEALEKARAGCSALRDTDADPLRENGSKAAVTSPSTSPFPENQARSRSGPKGPGNHLEVSR